ncbi:hypothetical protein NP493_538g00012 [Ridgeia piscesae]|uniref:Bridge-like lipid transfer protein family member 1 C-terminal domain-containing protein n=1 Tax=Ridgeia piscesae TaxID=27915 RepID=A0AAD9KVZ3_RIDPI|nr:hypothetical protein NP493_538g00012 [Ridgeia piscesae]
MWFNYKSVYDYWSEQLQSMRYGNYTATPGNTQMFLEMNANRMGICLPLISSSGVPTSKNEPTTAAVLTLESTQILVCSSRSIVNKGKFEGFTFRFADDFEVSKKDWRPGKNQAEVMNAMVVPNGTYEICSRTVGMQTNESITWVLNINWQMQGLNITLDTNIGKHVSALGSTLTSIMPEDKPVEEDESDTTVCKPSGVTKPTVSLPVVCIVPHAKDSQDVANMNPQAIVEAMNKQSKIIEDLKLSGAPKETIHAEQSRLTTLEIALFKDVCHDIAKKLNRQMQLTPHSDKTEHVRYGSKPKNDVDSNDTDMKRCLYTWLTLQYASEEMLVGPILMEFLEEALEPIPLPTKPTICDIGLMSFAYDMRRLHEILAFPKAWYSPTLMRHLFTGYETMTAVKFDECPGQQPHHKMGIQLENLETSIQYMGSSILMQSMSQLHIALHDEWRRQQDREHEEVCGEDKPPRKTTQSEEMDVNSSTSPKLAECLPACVSLQVGNA